MVEQHSVVGTKDDGTLGFLNIPNNENSDQIPGDITSQRCLVNRTFWVQGYLDNIPTKYSKQKGTSGQCLVSMSFEKDDPKVAWKKFFTGSQDMRYILSEIKKRNAFPRKVTLRNLGTRYYFE